ncbi:serine/arginine repetitive matrix protein 2-like [Arachis ipaensis]|uniref:serine/arginine repetitive matrix protein 2-like n=1 Tax=Arachis ipaensis TaxID=130454 RepID=UPI0007AF0C6E|nr:serine/arginine repetitive matrix protein 2-like [Arachis ipaensis]XP_025628635.1 serine/arginine repetitive matrix protein 2-like [Arachis hypogaea]QHO20837.1 uncharacterized protein DS421_11g341440 [Arachis hypogaea]
MDFLLGHVEADDGGESRGEKMVPRIGKVASVASSRERTRSPLRQPELPSRSHERRPFGGTGSDSARIIQELRHRMQNLEREVASRERHQPAPRQERSRSPQRRGRSPRRSRSRCTPSPRSESESQGESREVPRRRRDPISYTRPPTRNTVEENREDSRERPRRR